MDSIVKFKNMKDSTADDFQYIHKGWDEYSKDLGARVFNHLALLGMESSAFPVDRLTHSIQTAVLAMNNRESDEYVVCALIHDIGDTLCTHNHSEIGAAIVQPFVDQSLWWMVKHHHLFQGYYFYHHIGLDRNQKFQLKSSPYYEMTERFVDLYDAPAFDPSMKIPSLEFFKPMLESFLQK
jgi:predicted HD phosphohydrolase